MLDLIAKDIRKRQVSNVELIPGTDRDPRLPEGAVDLVLIANAYHEFTAPEAMMAAVLRCLKPGGRVVVIEFAGENDDDPVAGLYTMRLEEIRSEIESEGFQLDLVLFSAYPTRPHFIQEAVGFCRIYSHAARSGLHSADDRVPCKPLLAAVEFVSTGPVFSARSREYRPPDARWNLCHR
jgi:SAM-dependent methyltransferase